MPAKRRTTMQALMTELEKSSIGIIGGADGPTAIFVAGNVFAPILTLAGIAIAVGIAVFAVVYAIKKNKN